MERNPLAILLASSLATSALIVSQQIKISFALFDLMLAFRPTAERKKH